MWMVRPVRFALETAAILAAGSLIAAMLFRVAPGADVDSREANPLYSEASKQAIRQKRASAHELLGSSAAYYRNLFRGDFGTSEVNGRPVAELLGERIPSTLTLVLFVSTTSLLLALLAAFVTSAVKTSPSARAAAALFSSGSSSLLALPCGVVVLLAVVLGIPVELAAIAIVGPRLYAYCSRIVSARLQADYILAAEAMGISRLRILSRHLLPAMFPEVCGLLSLSVVTTLGVSVAIEVLGARSGLGELAWRAALDRDMPVVLAVTMVIILIVRFGTSASDLLLGLGQRKINAKVATG
jgi:peptide/nickel transport system permease protein